MSEVLEKKSAVDQALQTWGENGLVVMTSGRIPPNPSELLQSEAMIDLISELRRRFDTVIFDAPPILAVSDGAILARRTDGAILVAAAGRVQRPQFSGAVEVLQQVEARILGVVVTMVPRRGPDAIARPFGRGYRPIAKRPSRAEPATS